MLPWQFLSVANVYHLWWTFRESVGSDGKYCIHAMYFLRVSTSQSFNFKTLSYMIVMKTSQNCEPVSPCKFCRPMVQNRENTCTAKCMAYTVSDLAKLITFCVVCWLHRHTNADIEVIRHCFKYTVPVLTSTLALQKETQLKHETQVTSWLFWSTDVVKEINVHHLVELYLIS